MTELNFTAPPKPPPRGFQFSLRAMLILTGLAALLIAPFTFYHRTKFSFGDEERMSWRLSSQQAQEDVHTWFAERGSRQLEQPPLWWSPRPFPDALRTRRDYFAGRLETSEPFYTEVAYLDLGRDAESSAVCVTFATRNRAITWDGFRTMHNRRQLISERDSFQSWFRDRGVQAFEDWEARHGTTVATADSAAP